MSDGLDAAAKRAAYIHIPFCHRRCPYCDFAVVDMSTDDSPIQRYVDAVVAEIRMADHWEPLDALNIGGGTPSVLAPAQLEPLVRSIDETFGLAPGAEVSIEANPEDVTDAYAQQLRAVGINRMSLGVQSFDPAILLALGRAHTPDQAAAAVSTAKDAGMTTVNVDLIFGTPGESLSSWMDTVCTAVSLAPQHLSAYALTVERGTELSRSVAAGRPAPDPDDQADKYEALVATLQLDHYEVSNWAHAGHECRYNLITWSQGEYEGFGVGAHGYRDLIRHRNYRRLDVYLSEVEAGRRPVQGTETLDAWHREKERVFLGLRLRQGVRAGRGGTALLASAAGQRFVDAGVIELVGDRLVVRQPLLTDAVAREVLGLDLPDRS